MPNYFSWLQLSAISYSINKYNAFDYINSKYVCIIICHSLNGNELYVRNCVYFKKKKKTKHEETINGKLHLSSINIFETKIIVKSLYRVVYVLNYNWIDFI